MNNDLCRGVPGGVDLQRGGEEQSATVARAIGTQRETGDQLDDCVMDDAAGEKGQGSETVG